MNAAWHVILTIPNQKPLETNTQCLGQSFPTRGGGVVMLIKNKSVVEIKEGGGQESSLGS